MQQLHIHFTQHISFSGSCVLNELKEKAIFVLRALREMLPVTDSRDLTLENHYVHLIYGCDLNS